MTSPLYLCVIFVTITLLELNFYSFFLLIILTLVFSLSSSYCFLSRDSLASSVCLLLFATVFCFFTTTSVLVLFICYEFSLFPVCLLILLFGYQPEKMTASYWLLTYTVICSSPFLLITVLSNNSLSVSFSGLSPVFYTLICISFIVKSPLYSLHSWLPKAHVEAPLLGSILLAGVILNLGGYGLLILAPYLGQECVIFIFFSLTGGVVCSLLCCRAWDIKSLVAYSSVVHIGVVTLGALSGLERGMLVSVGIIVGHSLLSPLLFVLADGLYQQTGSRSFAHGHYQSVHSFYLLFLYLCFGINFSLPPFLNFWVEVGLFIVIGCVFSVSFLFLASAAFFSFLFSVLFIVLTAGGRNSFLLGQPLSIWVFLSPILGCALFPLCS